MPTYDPIVENGIVICSVCRQTWSHHSMDGHCTEAICLESFDVTVPGTGEHSGVCVLIVDHAGPHRDEDGCEF